MKLLIRALAIALTVSFSVAAPSVATAQDWDVIGGDERDREIIRRYQTILERTPTEGFAFNQILKRVGTGKGLEAMIDLYARKAQRDPDNVALHLIHGHFLKAAERFEEALAAYQKAVELDGSNGIALLARGEVNLLLQKTKEAKADFEKALNLEKDRQKREDILRKLADLSFAQRDWDGAQGYYDRLVEMKPRDEFLRAEYADVLRKYKRYEKALEQYEAILGLVGGNSKRRAETQRDIGDVYREMGQTDKAIAAYRKGMGYVRKSVWLYGELRDRIIDTHRQTDRLEELVEVFKKEFGRFDYEEAMIMGGLYEELAREAEALEAYERAVRLQSRKAEPRMRIVRILDRRGEDKKVIEAYKDLVRIAPREHRYQFDLVRLYFRLGDRKAAERALSQIESRFRNDPDVYVELADTYMRYEMQKEALAAYKRLVRLDSKNDAYILSLGEYYYQAGDLDEAVDTWMRLLDSSLEEAEAYAKLGQVLAEHGLVEKGLEYFRKAAEVAPNDLSVRRGLALAYERARRWNRAIDEWTWVLENAEHAFTANEARSRIIGVYYRQRTLKAKMREFQRDFSKTPPDIDAGFFLAESQVKLGDFTEAEEVYRRLVTLAQNRGEDGKELEVDSLLSLHKLLERKGDLEEAITVLQRLAELLPERKRDYYHRIADLSLKVYADDQAVKYARLAVEANPDDAQAQGRLGDVYRKMNNLEAAANQYRTAIDIDPRAWELAMKLADTLLELGQLAEAEEAYRNILKRANDETLILDAARRAMSLASVAGRLPSLEDDIFPLAYRTPAKPVYTQIVLEFYQRIVRPIASIAHYGRGEEQQLAADELDAIGVRALPLLLDALAADQVSTRVTAIDLLADLRPANAALPVARVVDDEEDPLRIRAAMTAAQIGDKRAAAPLIRVSQSNDPVMRELGIWALGAVGGDPAVKRLTEVLVEGQSAYERANAAVALGRIGGDAATAALLAAYGEGDLNGAATVGPAVVLALGETRSEKAVPALKIALDTGSDEIRSVAASALARIGNDAAVAALFTAYYSEQRSVRQVAARGLAQASAGEAASDPLIQQIREELRYIDDREKRFMFENLLRNLLQRSEYVPASRPTKFVESRRQVIVDTLRKVSSDSDAQKRILSATVVAGGDMSIGPFRARQDDKLFRGILAEVFEQMVPNEEQPTSYAVAGLAGASQVAALKKGLGSKSAKTRFYAVVGLSAAGTDEARTALREALDDEDHLVRAKAAEGIAYVGFDAKSVDAVGRAVSDPYPVVQVAAAKALGASDDERAVAYLEDALKAGGARDLQRAAVGSLARIGGARAKQILARYATHSDPVVRQLAKGQPDG